MAQADPVSVGNQLFADVKTYAEFGVHRTATAGDQQTAKWLAQRLRDSGLTVQEQTWRLRQFELEQCCVRVDQQQVASFPIWFPRDTTDAGLSGRLAAFDPSDASTIRGKIAFFDSEFLLDFFTRNQWRTSKAQDLVEQAASQGAIGAVFAMPQLGSELLAINASAPYTERPRPIPGAIIATRDEPALRRAMDENQPITLVIRGRVHDNARATNVVGTLRRGDRWLIVSTPSSGWFQCAGERGAGIALWLALAEWCAQRDSQLSCFFVANSGHELDYKGAQYLHRAELLPAREQTICWLHLGASIGNRVWRRTEQGFVPTDEMNEEHLVGSENLVPLLRKSFETVPELQPRSGESRGELTAILRAGYTGFGFYGSHQWFHTALDTPQSTGPRRLQAIFAACTDVLGQLEMENHASER